jgi:hypothetical protein
MKLQFLKDLLFLSCLSGLGLLGYAQPSAAGKTYNVKDFGATGDQAFTDYTVKRMEFIREVYG